MRRTLRPLFPEHRLTPALSPTPWRRGRRDHASGNYSDVSAEGSGRTYRILFGNLSWQSLYASDVRRRDAASTRSGTAALHLNAPLDPNYRTCLVCVPHPHWDKLALKAQLRIGQK